MKQSRIYPSRHNLMIWIVLFGAILRLVWLGTSPADLNADESAKAYNALSLIETGKTFRGLSWPLYFTDFDSTQPSFAILYNYLTVASVYVFGLSPWATRLPAALLGTLTIPIVYWLSKALFRSQSIAILAAGLLAFSPWHIYMSRWGIEPISFPVFFLTAFLFLIQGRDNAAYAIVGGACLGLCFYCYPAALIVVPLFLALFFFTYVKDSRPYRYNFAGAVVSALLVLSPLVATSISGLDLGSRAKTTSLFSFLGPVQGSALFGLHLLALPILLLALYPIPIIALLGKVCSVWRGPCRETDALHSRFLLALALVTVVPASATFSMNHFYSLFVRGFPLSGIPEILAASCLVRRYPSFLRATWSSIAVWSFWIVNSIVLYGAYTMLCDRVFGRQDLGYRDAYQYIAQRAADYKAVIIDVPQNQPFISFLFHTHYPPSKFLALEVARKKEDWRFTETVDHFDRYFFCNFRECPPISGRTLILTIPGKYEALPTVHSIARDGRTTLVFKERR